MFSNLRPCLSKTVSSFFLIHENAFTNRHQSTHDVSTIAHACLSIEGQHERKRLSLILPSLRRVEGDENRSETMLVYMHAEKRNINHFSHIQLISTHLANPTEEERFHSTPLVRHYGRNNAWCHFRRFSTMLCFTFCNISLVLWFGLRELLRNVNAVYILYSKTGYS